MLIGASTYDRSDQLPDLPAVRSNLTDLRAVLTDPVTGIFTEDHCVVVDGPETQADVVRPLDRLARQAEDLLLVYYSGHGVPHPNKDELYLAVGGTDKEILGASAVAFEQVREALGNSKARTKLLILDCCYSGMVVGAMSVATLRPREVRVQGTSVITSSPKNRISYAPPGERNTAFSAELIRLLTNGPSINGLPLTVQTLFNGLVAGMANRGMPSPQLSSGNTSGQLLLRKMSPPRIEVLLPRHSIPRPKPVRSLIKPTAPVEVADERRSGSLSDQPAPPTWPSVEFTPPGPVMSVSPVLTEGFAAPAGPISRPKVSQVGLFLLWVAFLFCADFSVAGFIAFAFGGLPNGTRSLGDLGAGIGALVFAVALGLIVRWRSARKRALGSAASVSEWPRWLTKIKVPLLIVIFLFCLAMAIGVVATWHQATTSVDQSVSGAPSATLSETVLLLWFAEGTIASGRALFRRFVPIRPDRPGG